MSFIVIIPARLESTRLPRKVMLDIVGKPMIERVYDQAKKSGAERVIIATDSAEIADWAKSYQAEVVMTATTHPSGTSRIAEAAKNLQLADDTIIVGVQADEPLINPDAIKALAERVAALGYNPMMMATVAEPNKSLEAWNSFNNVKVVLNNQDEALYFSRAPIGGEAVLHDTLSPICHHIGLYGYYAAFLRHFMHWPETALERSERLEQLRALVNGAIMPVVRVAPQIGIGVDTPADYEKVCRFLKDYHHD